MPKRYFVAYGPGEIASAEQTFGIMVNPTTIGPRAHEVDRMPGPFERWDRWGSCWNYDASGEDDEFAQLIDVHADAAVAHHLTLRSALNRVAEERAGEINRWRDKSALGGLSPMNGGQMLEWFPSLMDKVELEFPEADTVAKRKIALAAVVKDVGAAIDASMAVPRRIDNLRVAAKRQLRAAASRAEKEAIFAGFGIWLASWGHQ